MISHSSLFYNPLLRPSQIHNFVFGEGNRQHADAKVTQLLYLVYLNHLVNEHTHVMCLDTNTVIGV